MYLFVAPHWEEQTKSRLLSTEVGYYICGSSTLLWSPFSESCGKCTYAEKCRERTAKLYPELLRIRLAEFEEREQKL